MSEQLSDKVGYVRLGNSGLKVSKIILGTMSYGNKGWAEWVLEEKESIEHFKLAYELGINTWDTANVYSNGDSERIIGKAIKELNIPREKLVILTKVCMVVQDEPGLHPSKLKDPDSQGYVNRYGLSRKHIFDSVRQSLDRMGLEYIDVLQCHRFDKETPIEETIDALHDLQKMGLIRYYAYAKSKGYQGFISMQDFYSPVYREEEREVIPTCELFGLGIIPWSPLARGFCTRPWREQDNSTRAKTDANYARFVGLGNKNEENALREINEAIEKVAKDRGYSMAQVALAWVLAQKNITAPIIGSTRTEAIRELAQATHIKLTEEEIESISKPYLPRGILGHS